jgi:hypothetical protein
VSAESSNAADVAAADLATTDSGSFPLPWDATFETGDLSEFLSATGGWQYTAGGATLAASKAYAHGGSWGLSTSITTDNDASNHESQAMIGLSITLAQATYGAWYYLPQKPQTALLVLMKFAQWEPNSRTELYDIDLGNDSNGDVRLFIWQHSNSSKITGWSATTVPIGTWFHLQAFYRADPSSGRIQILLNGSQQFDTGTMSTASDANVSWSVGADAQAISPNPFLLAIDDADIH